MKICCIYVQAHLDYHVNTNEYKGSSNGKIRASIIPLGISYIASVLKKYGHNPYVVLFIQGVEFERNIFDVSADTDIICISVTSEDCWIFIKQFLNQIKKRCLNAKIIVGGPFVILSPQDVINDENVDAVCIGEGEKAIIEYVNCLKTNNLNRKIDNLYIKNDGSIIKCEKSVFIEDIDRLPYSERHMWDKWTFDFNQHKVLTERGCPYKCIYCSNHKLAKSSSGTYLRHRKCEDIINEIKYIKKEYPQMSSIILYAENIASDIIRFIELCEQIKKYNIDLESKISFTIILNVTKKLVNNKYIFKIMKEANIKWVMFGFESASKEIRNKLNRPDYGNKDVLKFCNEMKKNRIHTTIFTMLCYPYETRQTYKETVKWLRFFKPDVIGWFWMGPQKNTELYDRLVVKKECKDKETLFFYIKNFWYFVTFKFRVYITYKPFIETLFLSTEQFGFFKCLFSLWRKHNVSNKTKLEKYKVLAKQNFDNENFRDAVKYLNKISTMNEPWVYTDLAIAKIKIMDYKGALLDVDKALKLEPDNAFCINLKKEILIKYRGNENARL